MAPLPTNAFTTHFIHEHRLYPITTDTPYTCDGCMVIGTGSRLSCTVCKFDLHDYCAECPVTLSSSTTTHPHPFSLVFHKPEPNQTKSCLSCDNAIEGLAYTCKDCNSFVHPLCALRALTETWDHAVPSSSARAAEQPLTELFGTAMGKIVVYYLKRWFNAN